MFSNKKRGPLASFKIFFFVPLIVFFILLSIFLLFSSFSKEVPLLHQPQQYPELSFIKTNTRLSFTDYQNYFGALAKKKGADYAFNVLKFAQFPVRTDVHLLAHAIGNVLYKQKGADGISICTEDFQYGCSHAIVINLFWDKGIKALPHIVKACEKAPGNGAYAHCFHGMGHGVLDYSRYKLEDAINLCSQAGKIGSSGMIYTECVGGSVMEMMSGFGNPGEWNIQSSKYLLANDPLSPCDQPYMPLDVRPICYVYLSPHLFDASGAGWNDPNTNLFGKAFALCDLIPASDPASHTSCIGGLGKELPGISNNHDIRTYNNITIEQTAKIYSWCKMAGNQTDTETCINYALGALSWNGENSYQALLKLCEVVTEQPYKDYCYNNLVSQADTYNKDETYKNSLCKDLPGEYQNSCKESLLTSTHTSSGNQPVLNR